MDIYTLLFIFIALEIFESTWQKSDTLHGLIYNNFNIYQKNIFMYFIFHPTFFYSIILALYLNNFSFWMSSIIIIKFLDVSFKLSMMRKLLNNIDIKDIMPMNINMTPVFRYMNVVLYPLSFIFALGISFF